MAEDEGREIALPPRGELEVGRPPEEVLAEATKAAKALQDVIQQKPKPVVIHGKTYLEFEDWQTVGRFYGVSAKIESTNPLEISGVVGFEAKADAIHVATGRVLSSAVSMCMNDEDKWKGRPLFMLRSLAQTRACAKVLRNVLSWVVVLAGFAATPAEEMDGVERDKTQGKKPEPSPFISKGQLEKLYKACKDTEKTKEELVGFLREHYDHDKVSKIKRKDYDNILEWAQDPKTTGAAVGQ